MPKLHLSLLLLVSAGLLPADALAKAPEWLRQLDSVVLPAQDPETDAVALLDDQQVTVLPDGSVHYLERRAYRILRRGGQARGVARVYYGATDELLGMHGWSLPAAGKPFETDRKDITESALTPGGSGSIASDRRMKWMEIPGASPGNLVGYEIERVSHSSLIGDEWRPRDSIPVLRARYRLRLPPGWTYSATWANGGSIEPSSPEAGTWQWEKTNLEPIKAEDNSPPLPALAETLFVALYGPAGKPSSSRNWDDFGRWFASQVNARGEVNAAMTAQVAARSAGKATSFEKVKSLSEWAQKDIRYVSILLGDAGYLPRPPVEVLQTGFGDCKDKANFLRVMLREIGVESYMVLVNTQLGIVRSDSPPAPLFDHAVIAIRLPVDQSAKPSGALATIDDGKGGKLLLFDPTDTLTPFGQIGDQLRANTVLLVLTDSARLVAVPAGSPADNGVDRFVTMKLGEDGALNGTVREVWRGTWANDERGRMMIAGKNADLVKPLETRLSGSIANYRIEHAVVESLTSTEKPFEWRYALSATEYARRAGDLLMVRPRVLGSKVNRFLETDEPRRNPVAFPATHRDVDTMRIELPQGYTVESVPEPVNLDIKFAAYRSSVRVEAGALIYERVLEQKTLDLPLSGVGELKEFYRAISRDERAMAVLKTKPSP